MKRLDRGEQLGDDERALVGLPESQAESPAESLAELLDPDVGVLVASLEDEAREYRAWFEQQRSQPRMRAIVGINRACNFHCSYCCQDDILDGSVMSQAMIAHTAHWLASRALEIDAPSLHVTLVGGEPLLHPARIRALMEQVRALVAHRAISVSMGLITNGYFLDRDMVESLLPHGLVEVQVTLDGDDSTHHLSRAAKNGEDTFARIFANVIAASRLVRIAINGNYQEDTVHGFAPLIRKLAAAGLPQHSHVDFSPALEILGAPRDSGSGACTWSGSAHGYRVALHDEIRRHGYRAPALHALGPCSFHERHAYAIDVDGTIHQCPGFLGHPEWSIGHVTSGLSARYQAMLAVDTGKTCAGCAHLPQCGGGCLAGAFLRTGSMDAVNCEAEYFDAVKPHALAREYLLATSADHEQAMAAFPAPPVALPATGRAAVTATANPEQGGHRPRGSGVRSPALRVIS